MVDGANSSENAFHPATVSPGSIELRQASSPSQVRRDDRCHAMPRGIVSDTTLFGTSQTGL